MKGRHAEETFPIEFQTPYEMMWVRIGNVLAKPTQSTVFSDLSDFSSADGNLPVECRLSCSSIVCTRYKTCHSHTHTHTHTHTRTHTQTHTETLTHTYTHTSTHEHTHARAHTRTHTHTHTHTGTLTHSRAEAYNQPPLHATTEQDTEPTHHSISSCIDETANPLLI